LFTLTDQKGNAVENDAGEITNNGNGTGKLVKTLAAVPLRVLHPIDH
jgi:hypothetical protein